jgi:HK97 family phage major capsid protein
LAENTEVAAQDVTFGQVVLKAFKYSSKIVLVSMEILQDSFFDVGTILRDLLAERIGRITNTHFTTGTGSGQPQGVVTASGLGKTGASGQTTSIIQEDLIDLEHSVDPLYRPNCRYMLADSSLKVIKKLKDSTGRWLFQPNNEAGLAASNQRPTINGYPYEINQDVAAMTASAKSVLFGDFNRYVVRDVREFSLLRLEERYAEKGQVGFIAFTRSDGRAINAAALKHYINAAS